MPPRIARKRKQEQLSDNPSSDEEANASSSSEEEEERVVAKKKRQKKDAASQKKESAPPGKRAKRASPVDSTKRRPTASAKAEEAAAASSAIKSPSPLTESIVRSETRDALAGIMRHADAFKIAFWNVNGIRSQMKPSALFNGKNPLEAYMSAEAPDILCLNETKIGTDQAGDFTERFQGHRGHFVSSAKKGYAGVASFIKRSEDLVIEKMPSGLGISMHDEEARVQSFKIKVPSLGLEFVLVNTYVVNAGQGLKRLDYKITNFNKDLYAYLNKQRETHGAVLWLGDLNVAHQEIDIWNSKANKKSPGHTPEERSSFGEFLESGDWVDVFRHQNPDKVEYTFWSARRPTNYTENKGWRLDYFVASREMLPWCSEVLIRPSVRVTDHCPVVLLIKDPNQQRDPIKVSTQTPIPPTDSNTIPPTIVTTTTNATTEYSTITRIDADGNAASGCVSISTTSALKTNSLSTAQLTVLPSTAEEERSVVPPEATSTESSTVTPSAVSNA